MGLVLIVENLNSSTEPQYKQQAIKYNVFKTYKLLDRHICDVNNKFIYCIESSCEESNELTPCTVPKNYSAKLQVGYDLHYIMDQDGTVDENCVRAFINRITLNEQFKYLHCDENEFKFNCKDTTGDCLLMSVFDHIGSNDDMTTTKAIVNAVYDVIYNLFQPPAVGRLLVNEKDTKMIDESNGTYQYSKVITSQLFQYDSIPLSIGEESNYIIDNVELSLTNEGGILTITLTIRVLSIVPYLEEYTGNLDPINTSSSGCAI